MWNKLIAWSNTAPPLRRALDACRSHLAFTLLFSAAINLLFLAPALYMLQVYDRVLQSGSMTTLAFLSVLLVASLAVMAILDAFRLRLFAVGARRLDRLVTPILLQETLRKGHGHRGAPQAALQSFDVFRNAITGAPALAAVDAPWAPLYVIVCFLIHPWIGVLALIGGAALVVMAWWNETALRPQLKAQEQAALHSYSMIGSDAAGGETARAMGMIPSLTERQLKARLAFTDANTKSAEIASGFTAATKFLRMFLQSASLGLGAVLVLRQEISPGAIVAASILTSRALAPLELIVTAWRQTGQAAQALEIFKALISGSLDATVQTELPAPRGELLVENVAVRNASGMAILNGVSFKVDPGEIVGVIGPSGAGKTSLLRVLVGATPVDTGAVRLDGAKLSDWPSEPLGKAIGYLPQEVSLFSGTVADNIARFAPRSPERDAALVAAAEAAGVHRFILSLPQAYETPLGPGGRGLSAGQAQRIGLARALFGEPKLIVLDEPNAHLDAEGEVALISAMKNARERGATVILVAHRTQVMRVVNRLIVMKNGQIEGMGPRDAVLRKLAQLAGVRPIQPQLAGQEAVS
jgi:ATP-binding cassette subfamily C protein